MSTRFTFTIHGLDADNRLVRADVLAQKLQLLLRGLHISDRIANGGSAHEFIVEEMKVSSAFLRVREKQKKKRPVASCVESYSAAIRAVYDGQAAARKISPELIATFKRLSAGSDKKFQHAELDFESANIIRIDEYLKHQSERALVFDDTMAANNTCRYYRGVARSTFDGVLRVMDSRRQLLRATLITTAGGKEIECIVQKDRVDEFAKNFEHRVRIEGVAHYDADSAIPVRVDVKAIRPLKPGADLSRWRGAFTGSTALREDW